MMRLTLALADRYRVDRELGAGGMATVYLAHDLKHERDVAIKVLHPDLGAAFGAERFLSEIKTTAKLQHPHILALLDSGASDGLLYYVMPLVTGETLRARMERERQLPIPEAVRIAREVASALDYAHRQGVIHRDIKPENILLHDGQAIVADFGIALAVQSAGGARMTQTGLSLGTPQYMSPEQAMGERTIDARSDVYALGAVLYEMLAGDAPFTGGSVQAIVAKVLSERPTALRTLRDTVPAHVEHAVFTALAKLPADRYASAAEFSTALSNASGATFAATTSAVAIARPLVRDPRTWLTVSAIAASVFFAAMYFARPAASSAVSRQRVQLWQSSLQPALEPGVRAVAMQAAIAPDGSSIVFADTAKGQWVLKRKLRSATDATLMAGTDGANSPFFSPDGKWVAFLTHDFKLRKVPVEGGGAVTLAEDIAPDMRSGAWLADNTIVYFAEGSTLKRLSADGGPAVALRGYKSAGAAASITPLPGSKGVLLSVCPGNCAITSTVYAYSFAADSLLLLVPRAAGAWYSPTGHLLYTAREGGLFAVGFDAETMTLTSGSVSVLEGVDPLRFAVSSSGSVLYTTDEAARTVDELVWVTRDGQATAFDSSWVEHFEYPALSPDGQSLAISVRAKTTDLWLRRADGSRQKLVTPGVVSWRPSWMPDGKSLVFIAAGDITKRRDDVAIYRAPADGSTKATLLQRAEVGLWEAEVSRDGGWMVMRKDVTGSRNILQARRLIGDTTLRTVFDMPSVQFALSIALSPDGRWLAYSSSESEGAVNVYVTSFPDAQAKFVVSRGGGTEPRWSRDGRELFFESGGMLKVVNVPAGPTFTPGNPRTLFSLAGYRRARNRQQYDVSPDGSRFLMIRERWAASAPTAVYVENWLTELTAKMKR
ncbi:MAG: serine/threonine-protein kinase [Gemmatimonadaceae bacterium]|nr:serine/threonine-protein kinase [Gemmatimonadaceae bacterium]